MYLLLMELRLTAELTGVIVSTWNPEVGSANFRRDEFIFSSFFKVENRVRNIVRTYTEESSHSAVGLGAFRGSRVEGKERSHLFPASPVFVSLKTVGISEQLSESRSKVRPGVGAFALGERI
jgi:hypothetical protein